MPVITDLIVTISTVPVVASVVVGILMTPVVVSHECSMVATKKKSHAKTGDNCESGTYSGYLLRFFQMIDASRVIAGNARAFG